MTSLQFDGYILNPVNRQLSRDGEQIPLTGKAFDVLLFMASNPGRPLLKSEILSAVWQEAFVEESNLNQSVFLIRKALGADGERLIVTLPRRGYQFAVQVDELPAVPIPVPAAEQELEAIHSHVVYEEEVEERFVLRKSPLGLASVALVLILAAATAWLGWQRWEDRVGGPPVQVVLADTDGSTGDAVLDRTLATVFRQELAQSPFVNPLTANAVRSNLSLMMHKPDDPLTTALAREVCERSNSQAVLHGTIAHAGSSYVLTEDATNCADGSTLGSVRQQVSRAEELPAAMQRLGMTLRHDLGESRRMIARFNGPLVPANTASLEALKAYSQGSRAAQQGHFAEAKELEKQAVALDPNFTDAWADMSVMDLNTMDVAASHAHLQEAYDLRDRTTEPARLYIVARYHAEITGDLYEALRNYRGWVEAYPRRPQPWSGLVEVDRQLGRREDAVAAAQRLKDLLPTNAAVYSSLADAQAHNGEFAAALTTCRLALSLKFDGDVFHLVMLRVGYMTHDPALVAEQEAWGRQHPEASFLAANQALYAILQGRTQDAARLTETADQSFTAAGTPGVSRTIAADMADVYFALEQPDLGRKYLARSAPEPLTVEYLKALVESGDSAKAESLLKTQLSRQPQATLWTQYWGPVVRATTLLADHKPQEALGLLEPTRSFEKTGYTGQYLRAVALFQLNKLPEAEVELRAILTHPEYDQDAAELVLSQLQLARVLAREGKSAEAASAYTTFLNGWSHAGQEHPLLLQAKTELKALGTVQR